MSFFKKLGHALGSVTKVALAPIKITTSGLGSVVGHIPVVGKPFKAALDVAVTGPLNTANAIASGARVDHAVMTGVKTQIAGAQTLAPYAKLILHQIPLVGTGADAAIAAGTALVNGKRIDKALVEGVKGAIPSDLRGTFDDAFQLAANATHDNRAQLNAVQQKLAPAAQKVFQAASSLGQAARLQTVVAKAATSPGTTLALKAAAAAKVKSNPVLESGKQILAYDKEIEHGYEMAVGTFDHDTPPVAIDAIRKQQTAKGLQGFNIGMAVHVGMALHPAPSKMPAREQFGYFAVYGMQTATNAQKTTMLSAVSHDNSARVGANVAIGEIKTGWWPRFVRFVASHVHRKAS
jgi:hypothetical protein